MKFKIRYADQIVGLFSLAAMIGLVVLVFAIGSGQNWFDKKLKFYTLFDSGDGLAAGMPLTYKGFTIGKISKVRLLGEHDQERGEGYIGQVRADFYVLDNYDYLLLENSLVQLNVSPIGLGSKFVFYPGKSVEHLQENTEIYLASSPEGEDIIMQDLSTLSAASDPITVAISKAPELLDNVSGLIEEITGLVKNISEGFAGGEELDENGEPVQKNVNMILDMLENIRGITANINEFTASLKSVDGIVPRVLGKAYEKDLRPILMNAEVLSSQLKTTLSGANNIVGDVDGELKGLLNQLDSLMLQVDDVLTGVKNNPLLRGGVPNRSQAAPGTVHVRDEDF